MPNWEQRVALFWAAAETLGPDEVISEMDALVAERPEGDPAALYERASAFDFAGREARAEPLYRQAIEAGLDPERHPQAVLQLASTLRNLGRAAEAVTLLEDMAEIPGYEDARAAFLTLALVDAGRPAEGAARALLALTGHMTRYRRTVTAYAEDLLG